MATPGENSLLSRAVPLVPECRGALEKNATQRAEEDIVHLENYLSGLRAFKTLPKETLHELCQVVGHERFLANYLLREGKCLYVLLNQSTTVSTTSLKGSYLGLSTVAAGEKLGELTLLDTDSGEAESRNTVKIMEDCEVVVIDKIDYERFLKEPYGATLYERVQFMRRIGVFLHMPRNTLSALCEALEVKVYPPGAVIIHQGDEADGLYFLKSGQCKVYKKIRYEGEKKLLEINLLGKDTMFGEIGVANNVNRSASVVSMTNVSVYFLTKSAFCRYVFGRSIDELQEVSKRYASEEDVITMWRQQVDWEEYKKNVIGTVLSTTDKNVAREARSRVGNPSGGALGLRPYLKYAHA